MIANYHTHTYRCGHATCDAEKEYIEAAIRAGLKTLGFSDHCPMPLPSGNVSDDHSRFMNIRMTTDETENYVDTLSELKEKYKNEIDILIGFEVEYISELFDGFIAHISKFPVDYIIMGQHFDSFITDKMIYFGDETRSVSVLKRYVDLVIEGMSTKKFTYVAHPDLCNFRGSLECYENEMTRLINASNKYGVPLELNMLGLNSLRHYPSFVFWSLASRIGCDVVIGSDAHSPAGVYPERALLCAEKFIESNSNLRLIEHPKLVSPIK